MIAAPIGQLELALGASPEAELPLRLRRLGLRPEVAVRLTHNRTVLLSWNPHRELRLHAGYAWAPDNVLQAILAFIKPRLSRTDRITARRTFMRFPVERHAESRPRRQRVQVSAEQAPIVERLERLHAILNERHFGGALRSIPVRLSIRMRRRLGEFEATADGRSVSITISTRHICRDGWAWVTDTMLHEMIHQWQAESGLPLGHGRAFREKALAIGIRPSATVSTARDYLTRSR